MKRVVYGIITFVLAVQPFRSAVGQDTGAATGEAKVYTSRRTVGIVDQKAPKIFDDVTSQTALKGFSCVSGSKEKNYIIEATVWARKIPRFQPTYKRIATRRGKNIGRLVVGRMLLRSLYKMLHDGVKFDPEGTLKN